MVGKEAYFAYGVPVTVQTSGGGLVYTWIFFTSFEPATCMHNHTGVSMEVIVTS